MLGKAKSVAVLSDGALRSMAGIGRQMVTKLTSRGNPVDCWEIGRMPRIAGEMLDCVVYLYRSKDDAEKGTGGGGTGFLVVVPSKVYPARGYQYVVTNRHVVKDGATVIRLTTKSGQSEVLEVDKNDWILESGHHDLAVYHLALRTDRHKFKAIGTVDFLDKEKISGFNIGVADDAFMLGRFINHEGKQCNTPTARFGNIAMMPQETISHDGHDEVSFLVEIRSISGYSGSPIFVYLPPFSPTNLTP